MPICPSVEAALAAERCDRQPRPCSTSVIADAGSEALLRQVLEALDDGIIVADDSGAIALANRRLEEMFGYPLGTVTGKPVTSLIPADLHVRHAGQRTERPRNPKPGLPGTTPPVVAVRQDGGDFPVRISLSQVAAGTGQVRLGDGELGEAGEGAPAAPGAALLDFDRADCPLGFVVGEDVRSGRVAKRRIMSSKERNRRARRRASRAVAAPVQVGGQGGCGRCPVTGDQVVQDGGVQGGLPAARAAAAASRASISRAAIWAARCCWDGLKSYRFLRSLSR